MGYAKMTFDDFAANLKAGKYETLTGARRAIGKAAWSQGDKGKANDLAGKHFGEGATAAPKAAKGGAPKKAKKVARGPVGRPRRQPVTETASNGVTAHAAVHAPTLPNIREYAAPSSVEALNRQSSAAMVISALSNRSLSDLEQRAYACALGDYASAASNEGRSVAEHLGHTGQKDPVSEPEAPSLGEPPDLQTEGAAPRLEIPDPTKPPVMSSPVAQEQANRLGTAARALSHLRPAGT